MADNSRLVELASAVADGTDVDWNTAEQESGDDQERAIVRELRVLASLTEVGRQDEPTPSTAPASTSGNMEIAAGEMWGHLRISEEIGRGSFGSVYRAWDTRLERDVAVKLIKPSGISQEFDVSRALKEARRLARIRHKNVVKVFGADRHGSRFGLWMELVSGRTLEQVLSLHGPMSSGEASLIGIDLCHALAAVHGAGLLHRDVKAHNVVREDGGRIVLMDLGAGRDQSPTHDISDTVAGTPLYLAPELFSGGDPTVASDVYSLGVLLYHLVTADYPVKGKHRDEIALAHQRTHRRALRDARPDLPSAFVEVIERAIAPVPSARYRSAGELGNALAGVAGTPYLADRSGQQRPWKWPVAIAASALVIFSVSWFAQEQWAARDSMQSAGISNASTYQVGASFYAMRNGQTVKLTEGSRVAPGDKIFASIEASQPVFVYVINRDEAGQSYLLFPLPDYSPGNPVPAKQVNRLPGSRNGEPHQWEVTSPGGREHFLIYVTPQRLVEFEQMLVALPRAELGRTVSSMPLSASAVGVLRGVGGVAPGGPSSTEGAGVELVELKPLSDGSETTSGVWARRVSFDNPQQKNE